jgi:hypothetical protein
MDRFDISHFLDRIHKTFHIDVKNDWMLFNKPEVHFCIYEYKRQPRKGQTCAIKLKEGEYCSKHKKEKTLKEVKKTTDLKEVKKTTDVEEVKKTTDLKEVKKTTDVKEVKKTTDVKEVKKTTDIKEVKSLIVLLNKKINKYVHEDTRLVFYSKENKVVYGKLSVFEDKVVHLNDKDIDLCKRYQFRYDENLIKTISPSY